MLQATHRSDLLGHSAPQFRNISLIQSQTEFLDNGFPQVGTTQEKMNSSKKYFRFRLLFAELDSNDVPFLSGQFARCVGRKAPLLESSFTEEGYPQGMG